MSNSRTRIPSPARSMPLTPRRRETPRKTRSVCSPGRSNASSRLSCMIREHREQAIGSFSLSPLTRRSVLTDNTDIEVPGRKSWWRDLGENSRDVMEVLKDNIVEPHDIFENIEILSQEEKRFTLDALDSSNSESIQSIVIPQRKLFYENENEPQKKFNQFGTRETLEKLQKTNATAGNKTVSAATKELFRTEPRSRPVFPAALLDISANTTASEKTVTTVIETKTRVHNFFNNQQKKNQTTKRKNMFAKFIASDSEEELPEIQPKFFALQKKPDSRRPSLASRGVDTSMTSSMDIELDEWQLLPSSTMVDHQLNTTLTAGQKPKISRLSKLSEAETGTNSSDTSKTKSNKYISSNIQEKKSEQNKSIVIKNNSKIFKDADEEINQSQNIVLSSSNTSQSSIVTRSKNKSDVVKSKNASINKSRNTNNNSKNASKVSIKQTDVDDENAVNKNVSVSQNQNINTDNKVLENELNKQADNDDELNFTLEYDNAVEVDEENTSKQNIATIKSKKDVNTSKNTSQKDFDSKGPRTTNISSTDKNDQNTENKVIDESSEMSETNKSLMSTRSKNESIINDENIKENKVLDQDENVDEEMLNKSEKSHDQSKEQEIEDGNNDDTEQNQEVEKEESDQEDNEEIENDQVDSVDEQIESGQEESEDEQNETESDQEKSADKQIENQQEESAAQQIENEREERDDEQNEIENDELKSADEQEQSENELNEIENDQKESAVEQIENEQEKSNDEQNEIENDQEEIVDEQNDIENDQEEIENEQNEIENYQEESEDEQNTSQEEVDQIESEVDDQEMECEEANESTKAESDQEDYHENDDHVENQQNDSSQENVMECEDANDSIEAAAVSDQNDNQENESDQIDSQENESDQHDDDDQIENTESPNVSHDTTGRNRKKTITPEAILRNTRNEVDLTTLRGRNTSIRKTKSMIQQLIMRLSLEPTRKSMESFDGTKNSSAEGSGWDSHRTTRKTLRQTFGKDFTPRKSLRALVMEKSAKRRATAVDDASVARPQANSTEFPVPELSTNDYKMLDDPPAVHEVSIRTRQATIVECLKRAKKEWAEENAKVEEEVRRRLEQGRTRIQDPFKVPAQPKFPRAVSKPQPKAKKPLQSLIPLEHLPEEFIEDMKYKPPKRFAPRNAAWLTKRLYKYLETKLQPKYDYKARIRAEKFAQKLYEFVQSLRRRGAPDVAPPHAVEELKREMARLNFVKTHFDFYNFFHEFMPREVRIKVIPDIVNKIPHPRTGVFSDIL